jgi:galactose-1-phosphate uridylyltransferase
MLFERVVAEAEFLSPLRDFAPDVQPIEYRRDLLTGRECRINVKRTERVKQAQRAFDPSELVGDSEARCYFCPDNVEAATPKFPGEIAPEGRFSVGEATVFPNLFPFGKYHAIATVSRAHFLDVGDFTEGQIRDALRAGIEYFRRLQAVDPGPLYALFNWNHLPPSGASILHPHVQLLADGRPTSTNALYLQASRYFHKENRRNYWSVLAEEEGEGERAIGRLGSVRFLASAVPIGNNEVTILFEGASHLLDLGEAQIRDFAGGMRRILRGYAKMGIKSFNLTSFGAALEESREDFWLNLRLISRPTPDRYYTSDAGYLELLHSERVVESMPEGVAEALRGEF